MNEEQIMNKYRKLISALEELLKDEIEIEVELDSHCDEFGCILEGPYANLLTKEVHISHGPIPEEFTEDIMDIVFTMQVEGGEVRISAWLTDVTDNSSTWDIEIMEFTKGDSSHE